MPPRSMRVMNGPAVPAVPAVRELETPGQPASHAIPLAQSDVYDAVADRWSDLHASAVEIAQYAGVAENQSARQVGEWSGFASNLAAASGWQRELAVQGTDDLAAMLRPGLEALRTLSVRGQDPAAPAKALLDEFEQARDSVLRLLPSTREDAPQDR